MPLPRSALTLLAFLSACEVPVIKGDTGDSASEALPDADGDSIPDAIEGDGDVDGDGTGNSADTDSDGDGLSDQDEAGDANPNTEPRDSDNDGTDDYLDTDSDGNCVDDTTEAGGFPPKDTDGDGAIDVIDSDNDGDGIDDADEIGESCYPVDTDGDGTPDYTDDDSDGDGLSDTVEGGEDTDGDGIINSADEDSDGDGYPDADEAADGDPRDTDEDGDPDYTDDDSDGDGLSDSAERDDYGTDPYDPDSDGDGYSDMGEVVEGTDPNDGEDVPDAGYVEMNAGETTTLDLSFTVDGSYTDIAFVLDATCSMSASLTALRASFESLSDDLVDDLPDAQYGFATFDDYGYGSYGSEGYDLPFRLQQQITSDLYDIRDALLAAGIDSGADGPESTHEALYQTLTGEGYDQDCDGTYDSTTDVLPFIGSPSDPFSGVAGQSYDATDSSTGTGGGLGFRDEALPVIVYITDNYLRDPDSSDPTLNGVPGGCPLDAGSSDVIAAATDLGAVLIGVAVSSTLPVDQMTDLAEGTNSYGDMDGDGEDEELIVRWTSGAPLDLEEDVLAALGTLASGVQADTLSLSADDDPYGFVTGISPASYDVADLDLSEPVTFQVELTADVPATTEDQLFVITVRLWGDEDLVLDSRDILVVVNGS